jgi:diaminopimelate epimerase
MKIKFVKMEGIGNDYVYIDSTKGDIELTTDQIQKISNRNFGVGSDGVIFIRNSSVADFKMDMFNSDGSSSEMCGNGIRCVGKFIYDFGLTKSKQPKIETGKGILVLNLDVNESNKVQYVTVNMNEPILTPKLIPVNLEGTDPIIEKEIEINGMKLKFTTISMGNPHAVIFVDDADKFPVTEIGPILENHPMFPKRINVEFVSQKGKNHFYQRTWERGAGETLACGTGACAVSVAAFLTNRGGKSNQIDLRGGTLYIDWTNEGNVIMKGPAKTTFIGEIEI